MGNCQAAEAATVLIHHPGNRVERIYWSVSASHIMRSNPGHYVALVVSSPTPSNRNASPPKQFKLLKPHDTLLIGRVYRLISFEDVLKEFAAKKCVKLGKLLEKTEALGLGLGLGMELKRKHSAGHGPNKNPSTNPNPKSNNSDTVKVEDKLIERVGSNMGMEGNNNRCLGRQIHGGGQWRPALQSIAEVGS